MLIKWDIASQGFIFAPFWQLPSTWIYRDAKGEANPQLANPTLSHPQLR